MMQNPGMQKSIRNMLVLLSNKRQIDFYVTSFFTKHVVEVQQTSLNIGKELLTLPFPLHLGLSTPIEYLERERIFTGVERPRS